jgi:Ca2+-binding EF-hand superfamily protein
MSRIRNASKSASRALDQEEKVDDLERRLKEKVEIASGFSDAIAQSRLMEQSMKFFDSDRSGLLTFPQFFAALTKFNFVGVQREIESLFNRYDEYATGSIDYKDLAKHLWGMGRGVKLDAAAKEIVARIRSRIVSLGGADGYHGLVRAISRC